MSVRATHPHAHLSEGRNYGAERHWALNSCKASLKQAHALEQPCHMSNFDDIHSTTAQFHHIADRY